MAFIVKCPICGKMKKVDSRVKNYFKCDSCQIAIELNPNILGKSFVLPRKLCETCGKPLKECDCVEIIDS